jgi:hypothetical protein
MGYCADAGMIVNGGRNRSCPEWFSQRHLSAERTKD